MDEEKDCNLDLKTYHKPVLTKEVIEYIKPEDGKTYIDCTFGSGGHSRALLEAANCKVIAFDFDINAIEMNAPSLEAEFKDRFEMIWGNFSSITLKLKKKNITKVDGILADFGTSQHQIEENAGLSFSKDTLLDMRMSPSHGQVTASHIINQASEKELAEIFFRYGEEKKSLKVARAIASYREKYGEIKTTKDLIDIIYTVVPEHSRSIHPATKVFQALRIVVNNELNNIKSLLKQSVNLLDSGARLVCISFHSLEDRIVKHFLQDNKHQFNILTRKVVTATEEELQINPSSRSAKLRAAEKI